MGVRVHTRWRRLRALAAGALLLGLAVALGCSPKKITGPNDEPQTTMFVQFDGSDTSHTVNHVVHMFWFGTDADGFVTGYDVRFIEAGGPADPPWTRTTRTDSIITVQAPSGVSAPTFQVRAIDDQGTVDSSPATQAMRFDNQAPTIALIDPPQPADSTFSTITLSWIAGDVDGDPRKLQFRLWLNGNQANPTVTTATTFTVPTSQFVESGKLRPGFRRVFVQVIDDGGRASAPDSATWYVRSPVADSTRWFWPPLPSQHPRLLVVDDLPAAANQADNGRYDTLFTNAAGRLMPAGSYNVLRLEFNQPFASAEDLRQTLALFDGVAWYRGQQRGTSTSPTATSVMMRNLRTGFTQYVDGGGKLFIEALDSIEGEGASGIFPESMLSTYYNSTKLYKRLNTVADPESLVDWGATQIPNNGLPAFYTTPAFNDLTLRANNAAAGGVRAFAIRDTHDVVMWARAGVLSQAHTFDAPVGVAALRPGGGRFVSLSVPLAILRALNNTHVWVGELYRSMGLVGP